MNNRINPAKKGLTVKDLVTTGIFSAIFLVFTLIGSILFAPNPVLTFYMPMGAALLCGPVYLLMIAKVQKRWSVTILGIVMGIIWFVSRCLMWSGLPPSQKRLVQYRPAHQAIHIVPLLQAAVSDSSMPK